MGRRTWPWRGGGRRLARVPVRARARRRVPRPPGRRGGRAGRDLDGFDVAPNVQVHISDDLAAARDTMRPFLALYIGGMGSRERNFYTEQAARYGFGAAARQVQEHYLAGDRAEQPWPPSPTS